MDGRQKIEKVSFMERVGWLCLFYLFFSVVYGFTGWYTSGLEDVKSVVFDFEHRIPFLSWMVIPYMSSGLFFVYVFFLTSGKANIRLLVRRLFFVTFVAAVLYLLFPLRYSFVKPETGGFIGFLFAQLSRWDTPFNQAPSLHITYAFIFWSVIRHETSGLWKSFLAIWLLLMGLATLTIYQHHWIDILAACLLVVITFLLFPYHTSLYHKRNQRIAHVYFLGSTFFLLVAFGIYYTVSAYGLVLLWVSLSLLLVGLAYLRMDAAFLKKENGKMHFVTSVCCLPYIGVYRLLWSCFRKNKQNPVTEFLPGLFIGARLPASGAKEYGLDKNTVLFDLSAELKEDKELYKNNTYYCCPLLDIAVTDPAVLHRIADTICKQYAGLQPGEKIYVHCTMGYSRSMVMGVLILMRLLKINSQEAVTIIRQKRPQTVLPGYINEMI